MSQKRIAKTRIYEKIDESRGDAINLFQDLIRINSENPGERRGDESQIAHFVANYMQELGMKVQQIEPEPKRVSNLGRLVGERRKPVLLFYAHMDTVPAGDPSSWHYPPLAAEIHDGKIYGRGTNDVKQGVASTLYAIKAIVDSQIKLKGDVLVAHVADEETGGTLGIKELISRGMLKADYCLYTHMGIPENPSAPYLACIGHRGQITVQIETKGKAIHAAWKETTHGINAIAKMNPIIEAIENMKFTGWKPHPIVPGGVTISVTMISGGLKVNIVPDSCKIVCDCRFVPGYTPEKVLSSINKVLNGLKSDDPELHFEVKEITTACPSFIEPDEPIVDAVKEVYREFNHDRDIEVRGHIATSDSRYIIHDAKIPTIMALTARGGGSHSIDEHNIIENYITSIKMQAALIINLLM